MQVWLKSYIVDQFFPNYVNFFCFIRSFSHTINTRYFTIQCISWRLQKTWSWRFSCFLSNSNILTLLNIKKKLYDYTIWSHGRMFQYNINMIKWEIWFKNGLFSNLAKLCLKFNKKVFYKPEDCDSANCIC